MHQNYKGRRASDLPEISRVPKFPAISVTIIPMNTRRKIRPAAFFLAAALCLSTTSAASADTAKKDNQAAARIQRELDRIEALAVTPSAGPLRETSFSEGELNSWLAGMLAADPKNALRELDLKLYDDNRIEGKAFVDLSGASLPLNLKPKMNIYFAAQVIVGGGSARVEFSRIFLESQPIPVAMVDMVIAVAAQLGKSEAGSILDEVALPRGLKDLRSRNGRVILYY